VSNTIVENFALAASGDEFSAVWKLTRAMKTAGWRYKASSNGSNAKDSTGNPAADVWGAGGTVQGPTTVAFTISAPTSTSYGGRATVSGMTGGSFATSSVGHFLTITGATNGGNNGTFLITKYVSATSVVIENPNAVSETTPGTATFKEVSAMSDTYPPAGLASGAWWVAQGPSTLRVPIGTVASAPFIRGENVTQATSGAAGEVIGVYIDSINGGFLVIAPRVSGVSAGVRGWNNSTVITGAVSGATATPTGTIIEYVRELVFWYNSVSSGHIYYQCIDSVGEASTTSTTGRFSTMAATVIGGADYSHCPGSIAGNNPTSNGFPTVGSLVFIGQAGAGTASTGAIDWCSNSVGVGTGKAQILCANCIEDTNVSADGSFTLAIGLQSVSTTIAVGSNGLSLPQATINVVATGSFPTSGVILVTTSSGPQAVTYSGVSGGTQFTGCSGGAGTMTTGGLVTLGTFKAMGFLRVDDQEDGDVDPYVGAFTNYLTGTYNRNRTGTGTGNVSGTSSDPMTFTAWASSSGFMGWRRRGLAAYGAGGGWAESFQEYQASLLGFKDSATALATTPASPDRVACNAATVTVREPLSLLAIQTAVGPTTKHRKGTTRWWACVQGNATTDAYDGRQWLQLSSTSPAIVVGPGDGSTIIANQ